MKRILWNDCSRLCITTLLVFTSQAQAELNDVTQTPNTVNEGIHKSLTVIP